MRSRGRLLLTSFGFAAGIYFLIRYVTRRPQINDVQINSGDLDFQQLSREEVASEHLIDLNSATPDQLVGLGLSSEVVERIIESRPSSKLDLVSRMVMPDATYAEIRDQIAASEAREPVKVA